MALPTIRPRLALLLVVFPAATVANFSWQKEVDTVHTCTGGVAEFPWQYDAASHDVTMVYWRFKKTRDTVLAHHLKPQNFVRTYVRTYEGRANIMDVKVANAGLRLRDVTLQDEGQYLVELSGPEGATDTATLVVYPVLSPVIMVLEERLSPGDSRTVDPDESVLVDVRIPGGHKGDVTIQVEDQPVVSCSLSDRCTSTVKLADVGVHNATVAVGVRIGPCSPVQHLVFLATPEGVSLATTVPVGVVVGVTFAVLIVVIVVIIVVVICLRRKSGKNKGDYSVEIEAVETAKPLMKNSEEVQVVNEVSCDSSQLKPDDHIKAVPADTKQVDDVLPLPNEVPARFDDVPPQIDEVPTQPDVPDIVAPSAYPAADIPQRVQEVNTSSDLGSLSDLYKSPLTFADLEIMDFIFNDQGQLRTKSTGEPFTFDIYNGDRAKNQRRYEDLGETLNGFIFKFLEDKLQLNKVNIPMDASASDPTSFFYMSPGALTSDKLLVLIHGSGVVRAGQWARSLIINQDLDKGSQVPYIHWGLSHDYGVIVLNTNQARDPNTGERVECSRSAELHGRYVWENVISTAKARHIGIVAHSYGGEVVTHVASAVPEFWDRVFAVAFTDSVHSAARADASTRRYLEKRAINWVSSDRPRDTRVDASGLDAPRFSAGHREHVWTSYAASESVFDFLEEKYRDRVSTTN